MKKLAIEAVKITKELGNVIFIGALATYMHTGNTRASQDIDFVIENPISDDELIKKGYKKSITGRQPWFTPRGFKIDIFTSGIPGVSFDSIVASAKIFPVGKKGNIRVLGLECLIVAKHKAQRDQDVEDLRNIAHHKYDKIDWEIIQLITNDEFVTREISRDVNYLRKN